MMCTLIHCPAQEDQQHKLVHKKKNYKYYYTCRKAIQFRAHEVTVNNENVVCSMWYTLVHVQL